MAKWITPIIDRSKIDIDNRTPKAFFNILDWLRIKGNTQVVNSLLTIYNGMGIPFVDQTTPTIYDFPTADDINTFIENIDILREAAHLSNGTGIIPLDHNYPPGQGSGAAPDYEDVNAWERDLLLIRQFMARAVSDRVICGVANVGQPRLWQVRFRVFPFVPPAETPVRRVRTGVAVCGTSLTRQNGFRRYS